MKKYFKNLSYIIEHKINVFIEGRILGIGRWQLLKHDLSKFTSYEFSQYAKSFFGGERTKEVRYDFNYAWLNHKHKNKHHWQYWLDIKNKEIIPLEMPNKYVKEMLADWNAMSRKFHNLKINRLATEKWYKDQTNIILHGKTRLSVEFYLENGFYKNN